MIKAETISVLMGLESSGLSQFLHNSGYDGLTTNATVLFVGINRDGHFVYRVNDIVDREHLEFNIYLSYDHEADTIEASF